MDLLEVQESLGVSFRVSVLYSVTVELFQFVLLGSISLFKGTVEQTVSLTLPDRSVDGSAVASVSVLGESQIISLDNQFLNMASRQVCQKTNVSISLSIEVNI